MTYRTHTAGLSALVAIVLATTSGPSRATTYVVAPDGSGDFATIQAAIDACIDGDVIELLDGTHTNIVPLGVIYWGKAITIRSQSGSAANCIIDATRYGVNFSQGEGRDSVLENVTLANCDGETGAAVHIRNASPTIRGCTFRGNGADYGSSAITAIQGSAPLIEHCTFVGNVGGGIGLGQGDPEVRSCTFRENGAGISGTGSPIIEDCIIATNGYGGVHLSGNATIQGCLIVDNTAWGLGGGIWLSSYSGASYLIAKCTIVGNTAGLGAGIAVEGWGGATVAINNCIIAFNRVGQAIQYDNDCSGLLLECCDLFGNEGGDWLGCFDDQLGSAGNIAENPGFCDSAAGDYSLRRDSPCLPDPSGCAAAMGVYGLGCDTTAAASTSWGAVKALY